MLSLWGNYCEANPTQSCCLTGALQVSKQRIEQSGGHLFAVAQIKSYEANRIASAEQHRQDRKSRALKSPTAATIPCPHRTRTFRVLIAFLSHLCTHRDRPSQPQDD